MLQPHKPMNEATMEYKHPIGNIICVLFTIYTHTCIESPVRSSIEHFHHIAYELSGMVKIVQRRKCDWFLLRKSYVENASSSSLLQFPFQLAVDRLLTSPLVTFVHFEEFALPFIRINFVSLRLYGSARLHNYIANSFVRSFSLYFTWHWQSTKNKHDTFIIFRSFSFFLLPHSRKHCYSFSFGFDST